MIQCGVLLYLKQAKVYFRKIITTISHNCIDGNMVLIFLLILQRVKRDLLPREVAGAGEEKCFVSTLETASSPSRQDSHRDTA